MRLRRLIGTLLVLAAFAVAEEFKNGRLGVQVKIPEGWERDTSMEDASTILSLEKSVGDDGSITVQIHRGLAEDFDPEGWLDSERDLRKDAFKAVTNAYKVIRTQEFTNKGSIGYTIGGVQERDGEEIPVTVQGFVVINGGNSFTVEVTAIDAEADVEALFNNIAFPSPRMPPLDMSIPPGDEGSEVKDEKGNIKFALLPGWSASGDPADDPESNRRFEITRTNAKGEVLARMVIFRIKGTSARLFSEHTPSSLLPNLDRQIGLFGAVYGHKDIEFDVDESMLLANMDKSGSYVIRSHSKKEWDAIKRMQDQAGKGIKVSMPDPAMIVTRGRVAMLSPYIYITRTVGRRIDDPGLVQEMDTLHEGFEMLSSKAKLPPLRVGATEFGNTKDAPENAKSRKGKHLCEVFNKQRPSKEPSAVAECRYKIPAGFQRVADAEMGPVKLVLVAQDKDNNNVVIRFLASHRTELGANMKFVDVKNVYQGWRDTWETIALGSGKIKPKPRKVRLGKVGNAKGYSFSGKVDGFQATRQNFITDKKGWRMQLEIDVRGDGLEVFDKSIKEFLKSFAYVKK